MLLLRCLLVVVLLDAGVAGATNHLVRINEVMAGLNGDSSIQFVELASQCGQKVWGHASSNRGAILTFHDANGTETGRYAFATDADDSTCGDAPVLVATEAFEQLSGVKPDFIMPSLVVPIAGKVCFRNNSGPSFPVTLCLAYGGVKYQGATEDDSGIPVAAELPITGSTSIARTSNFTFSDAGNGGISNNNTNFEPGLPTPSTTRAFSLVGALNNAAAQIPLPGPASDEVQGETLFMREGFAGNRRTCATCHVPGVGFGLTRAAVETLPNDDLLFLNDININTLTLVAPTQPSDFRHGSTITGANGATAIVLAGTRATYQIYGGAGLAQAGNVISDEPVNDPLPQAGQPQNHPKRDQSSGIFQSLVAGNLDGPTPTNGDNFGIEISERVKGDRALIVENINGFAENSFLRASPSLLNIGATAPFGLSGEFLTLDDFSLGAVQQHFPRRLDRVAGEDFRLPTAEELNKMTVFMESIVSGADNNVFSVERGATIDPTGKTLVNGTSGNDDVANVAAPFDFILHNTFIFTGESIAVTTNGVIVAGLGSDHSVNTALPVRNVFQNDRPALFPYWDDLDLAGGGVFSNVTGTTPERTWHLEWRGVRAGTADSVNFEVRFHENSHVFEFVYSNAIGASGESATIGAQASGTGRDFTLFSKDLPTVPSGTRLTAHGFVPAEASNFERYATTSAQKAGRDLFFGEAKCSVCHSGPVLATSDGSLGTTNGLNQSFNTGVSSLLINTQDGLPTEQNVGEPANSRTFSTQQLFGVGDTAPYFHDASKATLFDAVRFYDSLNFRNSPAAAQIGEIEVLSPANSNDIVAFLENLTDLPFSFTRAVDFGNVDAGQASPPQTVVLTDRQVGLAVDPPVITGPDAARFSVTGPVFEGLSRLYSVSVTPIAAGPLTATLEFKPSTPPGKQFHAGVALSAAGVAAPKISRSPDTLAFGTHAVHEDATEPQQITITNLGNGVLDIAQVELTGSNAFVLVDSGEPQLLPQQSRVLSVRFDPTIAGDADAQVTVHSNDANNPEVHTTLTGEGIEAPRLEVSTMTLQFDARRISAGPSAPLPLTVTNTGSAPLIFNGAQVLGSHLLAFTLQGDSLQDPLPVSGVRNLLITFAPTEAGVNSATLVFDSNAPAVGVTLQGSAGEPELDVTPATLSFAARSEADGASEVQKVTLENNGSWPLEIQQASVGGTHAADFVLSATGLPITLAPDETHDLLVSFDPSAVGPRTAQLIVTNDDFDDAELAIAIDGLGLAAATPRFEATPTKIDFGKLDLLAGPSELKFVTIENRGDATGNLDAAVLQSVEALPCEFQIVSGGEAGPVNAGQQRVLALRFDPEVLGARTCGLRIGTDEPGVHQIDVFLHGEGTAMPTIFQNGFETD